MGNVSIDAINISNTKMKERVGNSLICDITDDQINNKEHSDPNITHVIQKDDSWVDIVSGKKGSSD